MIEAYIRPFFQTYCFDPAAKGLSHIKGLTADHVTLLAGGFGFLAAVAIVLGWNVFAIILLISSGLCDILDGTLARLEHCDGATGAALDIMMDRLVETLIVIGLFCVEPSTRALPCLLMLASILLCVTSFLIVGVFSAQQSQKSFYYSPGLIERFEAFIFFIAMILLPTWFTALAYLFVMLVLATAGLRIWQFKKAFGNNATA